MKKVYRLLRNNVEKGPFTIDELVLQSLQLTDLIWIDGRSAAWMNASEITDLKNCLSIIENNIQPIASMKEVVPAIATRIELLENPVNVPEIVAGEALSDEEEFERQAEELRKTILAHKPSYLFIPAVSKTKPFVPAIENDIDIIYHRKEKYVFAPHLLMASLIFIFFIAAWNKVGLPVKNDGVDRNDVAAKPYILEDQQAPIDNEKVIANNVSIVADLKPVESSSKEMILKKPARKKASSVSTNVVAAEKVASAKSMPVVEEALILIDNKLPDVAQDNREVIKEEAALPVEKKKTLGKAIRGLFKKKNKEKSDSAITP